MSCPSERVLRATSVRHRAAALAAEYDEQSVSNGEMRSLPGAIGSFTKGLRKDDNGVVKPCDFSAFVDCCHSGDADAISKLKLGPRRDAFGRPYWRSKVANAADDGGPAAVRGWQSMTAGLSYSLMGPDPQCISMPPAPLLTSQEVIAEMGELYLMALCRDVPFEQWESNGVIQHSIALLNQLPWFAEPHQQTVFRGILAGSKKGPYLSQFLIIGSKQIHPSLHGEVHATVAYGALTFDQRVRIAKEGVDYLTKMDLFLDAQEGCDLRRLNEFRPGKRFIRNLRDLATYVHYDAIYQAYMNACLILLANKVPYADNIPFSNPNDLEDKLSGLALYGPPHILTLLAEVSTRALKAVFYQKYSVHCRARPEAVGGLIHVQKKEGGFPQLERMVDHLNPILATVQEHNARLNADENSSGAEELYLLPQAYAEGSPMHPSYGSGHATVAGACVTMMKAFFKEDHPFKDVYVVAGDNELERIKLPVGMTLTVGSELDKLCDNISIGRDAAGVHWFSDEWESMLLGEKIAVQMLRETQLTLKEKFDFCFTNFLGKTVSIRDGQSVGTVSGTARSWS